MDSLYFSLAGAFVGFLVGLTGMGGGAIMTPILILGFRIPPITAVGTDLVYVTVTKIIGTLTHYRQDSMDTKVAKFLLFGGLPGLTLGFLVLSFIEKHGDSVNAIIQDTLGTVLVLIAMFTILEILIRDKSSVNQQKGLFKMTPAVKLGTIIVGFIVGSLVGVTSVGSGVLITVFLLLFHPIQDDKVVGTDLLTATFLVAFAGLMHSYSGNVDYGVAGMLLLGSMPGVYLGSKVHLKLPMKYIRVLLSVIVMASGVMLLR